MSSGYEKTAIEASRAATDYIIREVYSDQLISEEERAIVEVHVTGTLAWLITRWRSEGEEVERLGKTFIAAALETTAHLEDLVRMDEDESGPVS